MRGYILTVIGVDGRVAFSKWFSSKREANKMARRCNAAFARTNVLHTGAKAVVTTDDEYIEFVAG